MMAAPRCAQGNNKTLNVMVHLRLDTACPCEGFPKNH